MNKIYYIPQIEEFHVDFEYEFESRGSLWDKEKWTKKEAGFSGHSTIRHIAEGKIRVQHLHEDDFKELGMTCEKVPVALGKSSEGYICTAKINHPRKKDIPVKMDIFFTPANNWTMITFDGRCVFAGTTMNISELKKTLKRIQGDAIVTEK